MSNRGSNLLKALFFILLALGVIAYKIMSPSVEQKGWMWIAAGLSFLIGLAFLKRAFEK